MNVLINMVPALSITGIVRTTITSLLWKKQKGRKLQWKASSTALYIDRANMSYTSDFGSEYLWSVMMPNKYAYRNAGAYMLMAAKSECVQTILAVR